MLAIVGLGNPGDKYAHTRHNAGFDTLDILSMRLDTPIKKLKCHATIGETVIGGQRVALIKPQTFMNLSGMTVSEALNWFKLEPKDMLLIVDDIDLPFGRVRVRGRAFRDGSCHGAAIGHAPGQRLFDRHELRHRRLLRRRDARESFFGRFRPCV